MSLQQDCLIKFAYDPEWFDRNLKERTQGFDFHYRKSVSTVEVLAIVPLHGKGAFCDT